MRRGFSIPAQTSQLMLSCGRFKYTNKFTNGPCRYQAFRTIGEKKACFNEYLQQRAREEKEEARMRAKQARDDFITLLELSQELKSGMRYSKAANLFEDEPRWGVMLRPAE